MPALEAGLNPATWMLQVSTPGMESTIGVDFGQIYRDSSLYECALDLFSERCTIAYPAATVYLVTWLTVGWRLLVRWDGLMIAIGLVHCACSAGQSLCAEAAH